MGQTNAPIYALNRGLISEDALARSDLDRLAFSAVKHRNWMPKELGATSIRPGTEYIGATDSNNVAFFLPFIFSTTDTALIELTDQTMRIWDDDSLVENATVTASITNGGFNTNLSGWTDDDDAGGTSDFKTGGFMRLVGNGTAAARRYQEVTVNETGTQHAVRIVIERGPVNVRIGSTAGDDDFFSEAELGTGTHSIAIEPSGNFFIQFESFTIYEKLVDSVAIESSGPVSIPAPWAEADLSLIRFDQSGDVVFVCCDGYKIRKIERRSNNSWSVVEYDTNDGPFRVGNTTATTLAADATTGEVTVTSSAPLFESTHADALFKLTSSGQNVTASITAQDNFTASIRVAGTGGQRQFGLTITGLTGTGSEVTLQYSIDEGSTWIDYSGYTANASTNITDGLDNQVILYRIGVKSGDYTAGTIVPTLTYSSGTQTGVVRIRSVTNSQSAEASVLTELGSTDATSVWSEGAWSPIRGYPTSVRIYESRLVFAGRDNIWASITDVFDSFDEDFEGDAAPINRTIGAGPVDVINWLEDGDWLVAGSQGAELSIRSTNDREPLTTANFNIKRPSTHGTGAVDAVKVDNSIVYANRTAREIYDLSFSIERNDKASAELTVHVPEVCGTGITKMAVQRDPDTRIHMVRGDGIAVVLLFNKTENVLAFTEIETDGFVEDVVIIPGATEDSVYYVVKRTINSSTVRYLEKWSTEDSCISFTTEYEGDSITSITDLDYFDDVEVTVRDSDGAKIENLTVTAGTITLSSAATYAHITPSICKHVDSSITISQASSTSVSGLDHLEGETVYVWADGADAGSYTVSSGAITLATAAEEIVVGLYFKADWKSVVLAYGANMGTAMNMRKDLTDLGLTLTKTHHEGLKVGPNFQTLRTIQQVIDGKTVVPETVHRFLHQDMMAIAKIAKADQRLCMRAESPKPCTVAGLTLGLDVYER